MVLESSDIHKIAPFLLILRFMQTTFTVEWELTDISRCDKVRCALIFPFVVIINERGFIS